jgi:prevent-host-death family protein
MDNKVTVAAAKAGLSALLDRVEAGDEVVITRRGQPVARLVATTPKRKPLDLKRIEAFRARLKPSRADSVARMRRLDRY